MGGHHLRGILGSLHLLPETRVSDGGTWLADSPPSAQTLGWVGNSPAGSLDPELGRLAEPKHASVMEYGRWGESSADRLGTRPPPLPPPTHRLSLL